MPYIEITLDDGSGHQSVPGHYEINRSSQEYNTNYLKVTHNINYTKSYSYWYRDYFYLKFQKNPGKTFFYFYYVKTNDHIVQSLEVYFSKLHTRIPLIIGFKINDTKKYFTYDELNRLGSSTGFPRGGFGEGALGEKLKSENNARNKLKFNLEPRQYEGYHIITDNTSYPGFIKYRHSAKDDLLHNNHLMSIYTLFEKDNLLDSTILNGLLYIMMVCMFDFIDIFCTQSNKVLLIEFIDESNKTYFTRKDEIGYYWIEDKTVNTGNEVVKRKLPEIQSEVNSSISYQLDKNINDEKYTSNNIKVQEKHQSQKECIMYTHTPADHNFNRKAHLLYHGKEIELSPNDKINRGNEKLANLISQKFTEISTYALPSNNMEHLLIKVTKDSKNYYLHRFVTTGYKWRQIDLDYLNQADIQGVINEKHDLNKKIDELLKMPEKCTSVKALLNYTKFQICSIIVLLDKKEHYGHQEIEDIVGRSGLEKDVPPIDLRSNNIIIKDRSHEYTCLTPHKYKVFTHSLRTAGRSGVNSHDNNLYIRLYSSKGLIQLYDNTPTERTYLGYSAHYNLLYVYFYHNSTTPLLLCYGKKAYKPKGKLSYTKWNRVSSINDCSCEGKTIGSQTPLLLTTLSDVLGSLNVLYLSKKEGVVKDYSICKLFKVCTINQPQDLKPGNISIYKNETSSKFTLKATGQYHGKTVSHYQLYFNKFEDRTPLILVLHFSESNRPKSKYLRCSELDERRNYSREISLLPTFENENGLLKLLLEDNEYLENFLTYDLSKTTVRGSQQYNSGKIQVEENKTNISHFSRKSFKRYIHKPVKGGNKLSCLIYNGDVLYTKNGFSPKVIEEIQNKNVGYINVYYSTTKVSDPLLIEFNQGGTSLNINNLYYYHTRDNDGSLYWEQVKKNTDSLGIYLSRDDSLYNQLGQRSYEKLVDLLDNIRSRLTKSLVFIIDKKNGSYDKSAIMSAFDGHNNYRIINKTISVNGSRGDFSCITKSGFNIIEHNFSDSVEDINPNDDVDMIFVISNGRGKHNLIKLSDGYNNNICSLKYSKPHYKLYIYLYGKNGQDVSTPLLLCYNGQMFRPKDMNDYKSHKWSKVEHNNSCTCDSTSKDHLLTALSNVVGFLNVVKLGERPEDSIMDKEHDKVGVQYHTYDAHEYKNQSVKIKVSYKNNVCYRLYTHQPYGISGDGSNFRLGNVTYSNGINIRYDIKQELNRVNMYYNVYDDKHSYPLLLVLEFKNGSFSKKYFKPSTKDNKEWEEMHDVDFKDILSRLKQDSTMEDGLYGLRKKLKIEFENKDEITPLFNADKCTEDNLDVAAIAGGTAGAAAVIGTGITIGIVVAKKLVIVAATTAAVA